MAKALVGLHIASLLALLAAAWGIWHLRCEGFGCMGVGVAWFAWVLAFFVVLAIGWLARSRAASSSGLARVCRIAWWLQLLIGAAAVAAWVARSSGMLMS